MMTHPHFGTLSLLALSLSALTIGCGCSDEGCKSSSDCQSGYICQDGKCVSAGDDTDSDTSDTNSAPPGQSDNDHPSDEQKSDPESPTEAESDSESSTEDTNQTDSESEAPCLSVGLDGESCSEDCECVSGYCGEGICCDEGECCATTKDCDNDLCRTAACRIDNTCDYAPTAFECGEEDALGKAMCTGANACNGEGDCLPVRRDCGAYAPNPFGSYQCQEDVIISSCFTDCTPFNASVNCSPGAKCVNGSCVLSAGDKALNGHPCTDDEQCKSDHCDNDICCAEGACCVTADDCSDECRTSSCDVDNTCRTTILRPCGAEDSTGSDLCQADHRCDGQGTCLQVTSACSPYAGNNTFECSVGESVTENCPDSCTSPAHCAEGFTCDDGTCTADKTLLNGDVCTDDALCISGHCRNGYCCESGDCCATAGDCGDLCGATGCVDARCVVESPVACGAEDLSGDDRCGGNARCDGAGGCLTLALCNDGYGPIPDQFSCDAGISVSQTCQSTCNSDPACSPGFECDTDNNECVAIAYAENGSACDVDADCASGHCGNGHCCDDGDCCSVADDCQEGRCVYEICSDGACDASNLVPCGLPDTDGTYSNCSGGALCDGHGGCIKDIIQCDGPYAWNGEYTCVTGEVSETCHLTCGSDIECNIGYGCVGGFCVARLENGEGPCSEDAGCRSNHCNTNTGVCCEAGMCCSDNTDCGGHTCDVASHACDVSCDLGAGDDESICRALGDYHCANGRCESDLLNGEYICEEDSDCASSHCDTLLFGICCADDSAPCCVSGSQCVDGAACVDHQCATDCSPSGTADHTLCEAGFHCEGSACVEDINLGAVGCKDNIECGVDRRCENNVCCTDDDGECCRSDDICDDGNPCTDDVCLPSYHCAHLPLPPGAACDENDLFCDGTGTCDESGVCRQGAPPCAETVACRTGASCDEQTDTCVPGLPNPDAEGNTCSSALFCLNGRAKVCDSLGRCIDPAPEEGSPCALDSDGACTLNTCDEGAQSCTVENLPNGSPCNDGDPCTGDNICQDGVCVPGENPPCEDDNPCTEDECTVADGQITCGPHTPIDNQPCDDRFACTGAASMCSEGVCISGVDACKDDMGICTINYCAEQHYGKSSCGERAQNPLTVIQCGGSTSLDNSAFATREYATYNSTCSGSYSGKEAPVAVELPQDGSITLTVSGVSPSMDIGLALLGDWCNPNTCQAVSTNTITFDGVAGLNVIVLEAMDLLPPSSVTITAGACP